MATIKNTAKGPRGLRNARGDVVMIDAGQSTEGDFPASEVKDFKAMLKFEAGEAPGPAVDDEDDKGGAEKPLNKMNKTELLEAAANPGEGLVAIETVKVDDKDVPVADATNAQLIAAIEETRKAKA